jgi:hypothetical protein
MNKAFQAAFWKGELAALAGASRRCPYEDKRNACGVTFSRSFRRQWFDGFDSAMKELEEEPDVNKWRYLLSTIKGKENRKMAAALMENEMVHLGQMLDVELLEADPTLGAAGVLKKALMDLFGPVILPKGGAK